VIPMQLEWYREHLRVRGGLPVAVKYKAKNTRSD